MAASSSIQKSELERRQSINKATAIIVPLILIGLAGYATWVVVVLVAGELNHDNRDVSAELRCAISDH